MFLKYKMKEHLPYYIKYVDTPIAWAIVFWANRYPELVREELLHPNSMRLFDIYKKFPENWDFGFRQHVLKAVFKLVIVKYEQSQNYRNLLDWVLMLIKDWKPFNFDRQMQGWIGGKNGIS